MDYKTLDDLRDDFKKGKITSLPDKISVRGVSYHFKKSTPYPFDEIIGNEKKKPMVVYSLDKGNENMEKYKKLHVDAEDKSSLQDNIILIWAATRMFIKPIEAKTLIHNRLGQAMVKEADDNKNIIGDVTEIKITNIGNVSTLKGKVDTGAAMCSLHVDKWQDNKNGTVSFISKMLSGNTFQMNLEDLQSIKSADGGVEYRPVVALNVLVNGRRMSDILFNLNNRDNMDYKVLVGQNLLEKGKFLIDPKLQEEVEDEDEIDWDMLQEEFKDLEVNDDFLIFENEAEVLDTVINKLHHLEKE